MSNLTWVCTKCVKSWIGSAAEYAAWNDSHECHSRPPERVVVGEFEAKYGVRAPFVPSPHSLTVPGRMTFTVLERK